MPVKSQNFLRGAFFLSLSTAIVKIIGALYKIPIQNILGTEGSGLYFVAYNIFALLFVLATAGLPVAISKMVSESHASGNDEGSRIFNVAFKLFLFLGTAGALVLLVFAEQIAGLMNAEEAVWAVRAVAPSVFLIVFVCPYRGYYQGQGNMVPTAVSQVIEAIGKLIFGTGLTMIVLMVIMPSDGSEATRIARNIYGPAAAISGVSAGILFSAVYLVLKSRRQGFTSVKRHTAGRRRKDILKEMVSLAVPITLGAAVFSVTNLIDAGLTRGLLVSHAGFSESWRDIYYGAYVYAATLYALPSAFVGTIAVSLLPAIAAYRVRSDYKGVILTTRSALRVTALLGMPAGAGFIVLPGPILNLLYSDPQGVEFATPLLQMLGIAVIFVCIVSVTNAILQSLGLVRIPIITMTIGSAVKLIITYALVGNPDVHINGAPIGTIACFGLIAALNIAAVIRATGSGIRLLSELAKPFFAAAGMGLIALGCFYFFSRFLGDRWGVIFAMGAGVLSYALLLILIRGIPKRDAELLPGGARLAKLLQIR